MRTPEAPAAQPAARPVHPAGGRPGLMLALALLALVALGALLLDTTAVARTARRAAGARAEPRQLGGAAGRPGH